MRWQRWVAAWLIGAVLLLPLSALPVQSSDSVTLSAADEAALEQALETAKAELALAKQDVRTVKSNLQTVSSDLTAANNELKQLKMQSTVLWIFSGGLVTAVILEGITLLVQAVK